MNTATPMVAVMTIARGLIHRLSRWAMRQLAM